MTTEQAICIILWSIRDPLKAHWNQQTVDLAWQQIDGVVEEYFSLLKRKD